MSAHPSRDLPLCWEQHCKLLPGVAGVQASRVSHWTAEEVADFIHSLPGCEEQSKQFREEQGREAQVENAGAIENKSIQCELFSRVPVLAPSDSRVKASKFGTDS
ncbi:hypothetical protein cypCar_00042920, partial [Cyprinus carpio]